MIKIARISFLQLDAREMTNPAGTITSPEKLDASNQRPQTCILKLQEYWPSQIKLMSVEFVCFFSCCCCCFSVNHDPPHLQSKSGSQCSVDISSCFCLPFTVAFVTAWQFTYSPCRKFRCFCQKLRVRAPFVTLLTFCVSGCHCKFRFNLQFHWRYFSRILSIKSQGRNVGNGFGSVPQLSEYAWTLVHVHFENDNFNIFDLPFTPTSSPESSFHWPAKNCNSNYKTPNSIGCWKTVSFPGTWYYILCLFPYPLESVVQRTVEEFGCGGRIRHISKRLAVLGHVCYRQRFLEAVSRKIRRLLTHAQLFKPEPEFSNSGIGLFQSLLGPFRWRRVTNTLGPDRLLIILHYLFRLIVTHCYGLQGRVNTRKATFRPYLAFLFYLPTYEHKLNTSSFIFSHSNWNKLNYEYREGECRGQFQRDFSDKILLKHVED